MPRDGPLALLNMRAAGVLLLRDPSEDDGGMRRGGRAGRRRGWQDPGGHGLVSGMVLGIASRPGARPRRPGFGRGGGGEKRGGRGKPPDPGSQNVGPCGLPGADDPCGSSSPVRVTPARAAISVRSGPALRPAPRLGDPGFAGSGSTGRGAALSWSCQGPTVVWGGRASGEGWLAPASSCAGTGLPSPWSASSRAAGADPHPTLTTPRESAPRWAGTPHSSTA